MLENVYCFKISKRNQNASGCFPFLTERNWSEAVTRSAGIGPLQPPSRNWVSGLLATSSGDARRVRAKRRKLHLSPEHCSNFYVEQYGKMFFPNLTAYMSSGPLVAMVLARHKAISYWKELLGPSNSLIAKETHPDSLRAIYGTDELRNALHGSNDFAAAEREIRFMFPAVITEPIPVGQAAKDYLNLFG
ncbi:nucleoside diphosphate kinase homolog 5 isoform X3 [Sus scrofa]|uniref:nucleoside diphosphate kinase homolog 5 isoform X3 n=1 Tax=Sus scrofa TaxID=9823 RepID=UPI000A2B2CD8|nr:nucleoside diphosphate kinase homolog 5 isoform X3 [Sus scrofa]